MLGSKHVSDEALLKANDTIRKMFAYRHDILKAMIADGVRLVVLGRQEKLSDLPEFSGHRAPPADSTCSLACSTTRRKRSCWSFRRRTSWEIRKDPLAGPNQVIRVFAKALYRVTAMRPVDPNWERRGRAVQQYELRVQRLDERFDKRLKELYESAISAGKWKGTTARPRPRRVLGRGRAGLLRRRRPGRRPQRRTAPITTREALKEYDPRALRPRRRDDGLQRARRLASYSQIENKRR